MSKENEDTCEEVRQKLAELENEPVVRKEPQFSTRELADMEKKDWRGILAVGTLVGFFGTVIVTLGWRPALLGDILKLDTLVIMALQFYFTVKSNEG